MLVGIVIVTGFLSHVAYQPDLRGNAIVPAGADLPLNFSWPTGPTYLYAVTQGLHVNVGLAAVPFLLAKLWSVIPRLFAFPPVTSPAQGLERLSIALLVASAVFQFVTGIMNAQYWYAFKFNFVLAHYYGAVVFTAALALHVCVKTPVDRARLPHARLAAAAARRPRAHAAGAARRARRARAGRPGPPTISRRGLFAFVGGASALLVAANAGQTIGGPLRSLAFLAPRREDFPVNRTARRAEITPAMVGPAYQLTLTGGGTEVLLQPRRAARPAAAHRAAADRLRRGLDDDAGVDRRAAVGAGPRRRPRSRRRHRRVRALAAAARRALEGVAERLAGARPATRCWR